MFLSKMGVLMENFPIKKKEKKVENVYATPITK